MYKGWDKSIQQNLGTQSYSHIDTVQLTAAEYTRLSTRKASSKGLLAFHNGGNILNVHCIHYTCRTLVYQVLSNVYPIDTKNIPFRVYLGSVTFATQIITRKIDWKGNKKGKSKQHIQVRLWG